MLGDPAPLLKVLGPSKQNAAALGDGYSKSVISTKPVPLMFIRGTGAPCIEFLVVAVAVIAGPPEVAEIVKLFASTTVATKYRFPAMIAEGTAVPPLLGTGLNATVLPEAKGCDGQLILIATVFVVDQLRVV